MTANDVDGRQTRPPASHPGPQGTLVRLAIMIDITAIAGALAVAFWIRLLANDDDFFLNLHYAVIALAFMAAWLGALGLSGAYSSRFLGAGWEEFRRIIVASFVAFGAMSMGSYLLAAQISRVLVLVTLPVGLGTLIVGRATLRRWIYGRRSRGAFLSRTLVIGQPGPAEALASRLRADSLAGFDVVDTADGPSSGSGSVGPWLDELDRVIAERQIRSVALTQGGHITNDLVRQLAWRLHESRIELLVAPNVGDIAGPRVSIRPGGGIPLLRLDEPQLTGPKRFAKRAMDIVASLILLVVLGPLMLLVGVVVALTSSGPALFRQTRVGMRGELFTVLKFRTMRLGSELAQAAVWEAAKADGLANKSRHDPRVTGIGRVLRRWSLDELPQLVNVLMGKMSLVGPRPLQEIEVSSMLKHQERRHLTRPGLTGLWQISGRNETTWGDRMRLDLHYVEIWSPSLDLAIVMKTIKIVLTGHGAY